MEFSTAIFLSIWVLGSALIHFIIPRYKFKDLEKRTVSAMTETDDPEDIKTSRIAAKILIDGSRYILIVLSWIAIIAMLAFVIQQLIKQRK